MTIAVANSRGWIDYEASVADYWPESAQNGKDAITVRQLLSHEAGLVWLDEPPRLGDTRDLDRFSCILARQKPAWEPGTGTGTTRDDRPLHAGADPPRRSRTPHAWRVLPRGDRAPLQIDFYVGLPPEIAMNGSHSCGHSLRCAPWERCASPPPGS
jgi:Beta-lactamase